MLAIGPLPAKTGPGCSRLAVRAAPQASLNAAHPLYERGVRQTGTPVDRTAGGCPLRHPWPSRPRVSPEPARSVVLSFRTIRWATSPHHKAGAMTIGMVTGQSVGIDISEDSVLASEPTAKLRASVRQHRRIFGRCQTCRLSRLECAFRPGKSAVATLRPTRGTRVARPWSFVTFSRTPDALTSAGKCGKCDFQDCKRRVMKAFVRANSGDHWFTCV